MKKRPRKVSNARSAGRGAAGGSPAPKRPPGTNVTGRGRVRNIGRERVAQKAGDSGPDAEPSS